MPPALRRIYWECDGEDEDARAMLCGGGAKEEERRVVDFDVEVSCCDKNSKASFFCKRDV